MARGMPSRRALIRATAAALSPPRTKLGRAAWARSTKRRTASKRMSSAGSWARAVAPARPVRCSGVMRSASGGTPSPSRGNSCSPDRWRIARLVTTKRSPGAARSRSATTGAAAVRRSKLSRTRRTCWPARCSDRSSSGWRMPVSTTPTAWAIVPGTSIGSSTGSNGTKNVPSGKSPAARWASSIAKRVLPMPPGPVTVRSRAVPSRRWAAASSLSRPMNVVTDDGRLLGRASIVRRAGKSAGSPSTTSWLSRSGSGKSLRR